MKTSKVLGLAVLFLLVISCVAIAADNNQTSYNPPSVKVTYLGVTPIKEKIDLLKLTRLDHRIKIAEIKNTTVSTQIISTVEGGLFGTTGELGKLLGGKETITKVLLDKDGAEILVNPLALEERMVAEETLNETELFVKDSIEDAAVIGEEVKPIMEVVQYPYTFAKTEVVNSTETVTTNITIQKLRYDENTTTMWYWVNATRNGKEIATDSPIWIYPAPISVLVSQDIETISGNVTLILREDPKVSAEIMLMQIVNQFPIGNATVGTRE